MKRFLFSIALTLVVFSVYAQEHLTFKGIPIEGSMSSFCQKLQSKGFIKLASNNNITLFSGDFTGQQATIGVSSTDDGKNVCHVGVLFNSIDDWSTLVKTYTYYKELYIKKYGNPTLNEEYNPSLSDNNRSLMYELINGTATYTSAWEVVGGTIELSIIKSDPYGTGAVIISYRDAMNAETKIQNDLSDI